MATRSPVEWPLIEHEPLVMHTRQEARAKIPKLVKAPTTPSACPKPIRRFTTKGVYDLGKKTHLSFTQGAGHGGSHPHLAHEFASPSSKARALPERPQSANWTCVGILAHEQNFPRSLHRSRPHLRSFLHVC
jgi:hypothetical protein